MANIVEVKVPDIGDFKDVPVIELLVKVGDTVKAEDSLVTLESDKATMDVPSPVSGVVTELKLKIGDKVAEGSLVALIDSAAAGQAAAPVAAAAAVAPAAPAAPAPASPAAPAASAASAVEVRVPDIGDFKDVPIIELLVKVGDTVKAEDSLMTLESDKATMDIPSPVSGVVSELKVKVGDKVAEGVLLALVKVPGGTQSAGAGATAAAAPVAAAAAVPASAPVAAAVAAPASAPAASGAGADYRPGDTELISAPPRVTMPTPADRLTGKAAHASPSVRRFARELGVDVSKVPGTGPKGRILQGDIQAYVKGVLSAPPAAAPAAAPSGGGLDLLPWPKIDFSKFGPIDVQPLSRIKKISGANLSRNWVMIPAVTYHEDADITDLEAFRVQINKENEKAGGAKLTMLAFLIKACVKAMQKYPEFNSSIDGDNLVMKKYFNIGFAADTPNGLMVPVIKNADSKGVFELAKESGDLAKQAREGKLKPADMQGACFTISSLGGIGGTYFAPIVNAPEVAILGVNKSAMKPVWDGKAFVPRLTLPLSLTADHRVIDGALATRFNVYLAQLLADMRRSML
jgi:pyruvate dehydrogenase E2 component (dihydrolipoamide acetyltransferase)